MTLPDRAEELDKQALKIAIDFAERFQKNYPSMEIISTMTLALAKEIDLLLKDNPAPASVNMDELKTKYYRAAKN